jgi:tetratricopeptide (TPR) repeat protein
MKTLGWTFVLITGVSLSVVAQNWLDAQRRTPEAIEESLYLTSGRTLKRASLGFDGLLADLYWVRTVQYFGRELERQRSKSDTIDLRQMRLLEQLLAITTELDPHHIPAYRFGAFFLRYIDQEKAISFAEQGIRNNPDQWRLYQDLGFVYFREGRYREAGEVYRRGSRVAGAPAWMHAMAASMIAKGGDRETSREMFRRLCEGSEDRFIKQICAEK